MTEETSANIKIYMVNEGKLEQVGVKPPVFSTGDAYLVDTGATIFIWLGKDCSVDEKGTAAVEAQNLDKERSGVAKITTYDQGQEGADLMKVISGVRFVERNIAKSFLVDVTTGSYAGHADHIDAMYRVDSEAFEDINAMKFLQVPLKPESLDSEDAFIADMGDEILVWIGKDANVKERVMAGKWARQFDADRAGAQKVHIYEEGDPEEEEFFKKAFEGGKVVKSSNLGEEPKPEPAPAPVKKEVPKPEPAPAPVKKEEPKVEAAPASEDAGDLKVVGGIIEVADDGSRRHCPKCGNDKPYMIKEFVDRNKIINPYPVIYGKKYKCGQCGAEWRYVL